jgi:hypothetical protein
LEKFSHDGALAKFSHALEKFSHASKIFLNPRKFTFFLPKVKKKVDF